MANTTTIDLQPLNPHARETHHTINSIATPPSNIYPLQQQEEDHICCLEWIAQCPHTRTRSPPHQILHSLRQISIPHCPPPPPPPLPPHTSLHCLGRWLFNMLCYDEIVLAIPYKTKCIDDILLWKDDHEGCFYQVVQWLDICSRNGITLRPDGFVINQDIVEFTGFAITMDSI